MRQIILVGLALAILSGCASNNIMTRNDRSQRLAGSSGGEDDQVADLSSLPELKAGAKKGNPYVGIKGYLNRPPLFADEKSQMLFQRCLPIEVTSIKEVDNVVTMTVIQEGNKLNITGLNRKKFIKNSNNRISAFDSYFVKRLDWMDSERKLAQVQDRVCSGQAFKGMPVGEFQFVYGDPELRRVMTTNEGSLVVWTYKNVAQNSEQHYYFRDSQLHSWTTP